MFKINKVLKQIFFFFQILLAINFRLLACLALAHNNAKGTVVFSIKCTKNFPSFVCALIGADHLILLTKIKLQSMP